MTDSRTDASEAMVGGCACGQVRYQIKQPPIFVHGCHCSHCQRESGSAFALNAMVESDQVAVMQGQVALIDIPTASGRGQTIARCTQCQVALWSHYGGLGRLLSFVKVGTLDRPNECPPDVHIYTGTRQAWLESTSTAPVFAEYYNRHDLWDVSQLARFDALLQQRQKT